jgi:hypothetical protein
MGVLRAIPNTTTISRELVPLPASRSIYRNVSCSVFSLPAQNVLDHHEVSMPNVADPGGNLQCRKLAGL